MNRFRLLLSSLLLCTAAFAADRPNVVVILADDLGWGTVGCYGADPALVKTPNIDRLSREGRRFTDGNTTSSVCSPTRYAMVTGRYCWRTDLQSEVLGTTAPLHIETTRLTIASMLKEHGYSTAAIGKWHLGYGTAEKQDFAGELKPGPLEVGFDYHFGVPSNHGDVAGVFVEDHWVYGINKDSPREPSPPYVTIKEGKAKGGGAKNIPLNAPKRVDEEVMPTLTDKTVAWINRQSDDKPFFLYYTPVAVHNPVTPSSKTKGTSKAGSFGDWVQELDMSVGRVIEALEKKGVLDKTLILFTSDNGGVNIERDCPQTEARKAGLKQVGPFRGGKHDVWEGGFKVPYIVRWPGHVPAGTTCDETVSIVDTLASIAAIVDHKLPAANVAAEDSYDVSKAWLGQKYEGTLRPDVIVHSADGNFAIRKGPWKWIEGVAADDVKTAAKKAHKDQFQRMLYRLADDIAETKEVSAQHPDVVKDMEALLNRYRDGGYSRELPPETTKPKKLSAATLPALSGELLVDESFAQMPGKPWLVQRGAWSVQDGVLVGRQGKKEPQNGALKGPLNMSDGTVQFDLRFDGAERLAFRIESAVKGHSYRVEVGSGKLSIVRNPAIEKPGDDMEQLAKTKVKLVDGQWYTLNVKFKGDEITAQINGVTVSAKHPFFADPKNGFTFVLVGDTMAFRNLQEAKQ